MSFVGPAYFDIIIIVIFFTFLLSLSLSLLLPLLETCTHLKIISHLDL